MHSTIQPQTGLESDGSALLQRRQLSYYQAWSCSLAQCPMQAVPLSTVQSACCVVVSGFPATTTAEELRAAFESFCEAHGAAVAPGRAVVSCEIQPGSPITAVLQLRCSIEASNCLAFDGMQWRGCTLQVERPRSYCAETAILLGPTEPNPAVCAAVAGAAAHQAAADGNACAETGAGSSFATTLRTTAVPAAAQGAPGHLGRSSAPAASGAGPYPLPAPAAGAGMPSGASKGGPRDLVLPTDQSKQDEVFIGGLPSHWKAQQLKELLAPYGQLKSLSVAMDASTGKNKGYAFVVFSSPDMVSHAIEELDCRVVEGKILAVQRATEGKVTYGRDSMAGCMDMGGSLREGGFVGPQHGPREAPAGPPPQQQQQQQQQQPVPAGHQHPILRHHHQHHHRSSSTGSALPPHLPPPVVVDAAASSTAGSSVPGFGGHSRGSSAGAAAAAASMGPLPPPATADSSLLGPRPPPAAGGPGTAGAASMHHSGPSSAKQYDINELYIGDLPLTWDEDAVRRLLGRFGRIKYFTLRNGRDKNFAFCKFKDSSVVDAAIAGLHGKIVDGYFLNVRRAIEGKQQATGGPGASPQAQPWLAGKQPHHQQQQQQQQNVRASFDATSSRATASAHRPRMSADQQQLSKLAAAAMAAGPPIGPAAGPGGKAGGLSGLQFGPRGSFMAAGGAAGQQQGAAATAGKNEQQQQQQQKARAAADVMREQQASNETDRAKSGSPAGASAAAGTSTSGGKQQQDALSAGSTAPSTPGTPTVEQAAAAGQDQQQQPAVPAAAPAATAHAAAAPGAPAAGATPGHTLGTYGPFMGPQLLPRPTQQPTLHQQLHLPPPQQQQQQMLHPPSAFNPALPLFPGPLPPPAQASSGASLFGPNGPASWPGSASIAAAAAAAAAAVAASPAAGAGNLALPGAPGGSCGLGLGIKQQQQQTQQTQPLHRHQQHQQLQESSQQSQSLLQTWDMLSPWSLFSHTAPQ